MDRPATTPGSPGTRAWRPAPRPPGSSPSGAPATRRSTRTPRSSWSCPLRRGPRRGAVHRRPPRGADLPQRLVLLQPGRVQRPHPLRRDQHLRHGRGAAGRGDELLGHPRDHLRLDGRLRRGLGPLGVFPDRLPSIRRALPGLGLGEPHGHPRSCSAVPSKTPARACSSSPSTPPGPITSPLTATPRPRRPPTTPWRATVSSSSGRPPPARSARLERPAPRPGGGHRRHRQPGWAPGSRSNALVSHIDLVRCAVDTGDTPRARELADRYLAVYPDHVHIALARAELILAEGDVAGGLEQQIGGPLVSLPPGSSGVRTHP